MRRLAGCVVGSAVAVALLAGTAWGIDIETVTRVVTLMAHGCPLQAIVVAFGVDERTVADWLRRAGVQGQAI